MPVTHPLLRPPPNPFTPYRTLANRRYASPPPCLVNVYPPNNSFNRCPCILMIHGGGWSGGSRTDGLLLALPWIRKGWAVASMDYRLSGVARWPAQSVDVAQCIRYLQVNAAVLGIWDGGVFAQGGSAGGHLAALAGMLPTDVRYQGAGLPGVPHRPLATLVDYAPWDLATWLDGPSSEPNETMVDGLLGTPRTAAKMEEASPLTWVAADNVRMHLRHGDSDDAVPWQQTEVAHAELAAVGADHSYEISPNLEHVDLGFYSNARMDVESDRFATTLHELVPA